ncbi:MAG TPA: hypothetical protein VGP41_18015 [Candidatus Lustribacter sp.]|jgi:hypothetical protein|nr:hypothetical protein [Candidatus Lustribacter sp.]
MKARALATLSVLALATAFAPLTVRAASGQAVTYDLTTRETGSMKAGEYQGRLRMTVEANGIITGWFTNTQGSISNVIGGVDGSKIWIQIGDAGMIGRNFYQGTFVGGKIEATAPNTSRTLNTWSLEATPRTHY